MIESGRVVGRWRVDASCGDRETSASAVAAGASSPLPAEDLEDLCPGPEAVAVWAVKVLVF